MRAYIDARGGEGGTDRGHVVALDHQNNFAEKRIRALFGFQHPKAALDLSLKNGDSEIGH